MVNIWKDRNLRRFKICKEGVPGSSTALKFLYQRHYMNLNKTWMIMVIIHTNNLAQKLLYLGFHFLNVVKTARHLLHSLTWGRRFKLIDIILQNWDYAAIYFWTHPIFSHPDLISSFRKPLSWVCSPNVELLSPLTFGLHLEIFNTCFPSFSLLFLSLNSLSIKT